MSATTTANLNSTESSRTRPKMSTNETTSLDMISPMAMFQNLSDSSAPTDCTADKNAARLDIFPGNARFTATNGNIYIPKEDVQVIIILDNSYSMGLHFEDQKKAARQFIQQVCEANIPLGHAYIVFFDNFVNGLARTSGQASSGTIDAASPTALDDINRIKLGGSTSFKGALEEVERLRRLEKRLFVFFSTDGQANPDDGWESVSRRLNENLGDEDHIVPLYFGDLPSEEEVASLPTLATRGDNFYNISNSERVVQSFCLLRDQMAYNADPRHVTDVALLLEWITEAVTVLAENATVNFGSGIRMAVFNNGETICGATSLTEEQFGVLREIETLEGQCQVGDVTVALTAQVVVNDEPMTASESVDVFRMAAASCITNLRDTITLAHTGNREAQLKLLDFLQKLRDERKRLRVPEDDPMAVRLVQAHDEVHRIISGAIHTDGDASAFSVRGQTSALMRLQRGGIWVAQTTHGRKNRKAQRAVQRVNEMVIKHFESVKEDIENVQSALSALTVEYSTSEIMCDVPEDPVFATTDWKSAVVIVAGPGAQLTTEEKLNPYMTTAIDNAGSATGVIQTVLSGVSFAKCIEYKKPLFRSSMVGIFVVPFRERTEAQQRLLEAIAKLTAMQIICGVTTQPSESGAAVYPAVAAAVLLDPTTTNVNVSGALAFAPYYCTMVQNQVRNGCPITDYLNRRPMQWNGLQLSAADDNALTSLQMAMVVPAFMALVYKKPVDRRNCAVIFTTAQRGMAYCIKSNQKPAAWIDEEKKQLLSLLTPKLVPAQPVVASELLNKILRHLTVIYKPKGKVGPEHLDNILRVALRFTMAPDTIQISHEHPIVQRALLFLWNLAESDTSRPITTVHKPRETWNNTLQLMARLHALLGEEHLEETICRADANKGWMRNDDVDRFVKTNVPNSMQALAAVLSPLETLWLALVMLDTQGNTSRLRDLGESAGPGDGDPNVVNRAFWEQWMRGTDRVCEAEAKAHQDLLFEMVKVAIAELNEQKLESEVLFGLFILAARSNYTEMMEELYHTLCSFSAVAVALTQRDWRKDLLGLPGQAVVVENARIKEDVLRTIDKIASTASKQEAFEDTPSALFALPDVQKLMIDLGVTQAEIDERLGSPGATPAMPRSDRGLNRQLCRMARNAGADVDTPIAPNTQVFLFSSDEARKEYEKNNEGSKLAVKTFVLHFKYHAGTLFAPPHSATRIVFQSYGAGGGFVANRIDFQDGVQERNPASDDVEERRWCSTWNKKMYKWRNSVLKASKKVKVATKATPDGNENVLASSTISMQELDVTIDTVGSLLLNSPSPEP